MKAAPSTSAEAPLGTQLDAEVMSQAVYIPYGNDTLLFASAKNVTNYYIDTALGSLVDLAALGVQ
jgi:hypothetical protein